MDTSFVSNLMYFSWGANFMCLIVLLLYILVKWRRNRKVELKAIWMLLGYWSLVSLVTSSMLVPEVFHNTKVHYLINLFQSTCFPTSILFFISLTRGKDKFNKLFLFHESPFGLFMVLYGITDSLLIYNIGVLFTLAYGVVLVIFAFFNIRRFHSKLVQSYSYLENLDLSWMYWVLVLFLVMLTSWSLSAYLASYVADIVYFFTCSLVWYINVHFVVRREQIDYDVVNTLSSDKEDDGEVENDDEVVVELLNNAALREKRFAEEFDKAFNEKKVFLNPKLTIIDLALELHTNRTYVSKYMNSSLGQSFYDYVNKRRVEYAEVLLKTTDNTLESVASEAGFNSLSSFRRAFIKLHNTTPGNYRMAYILKMTMAKDKVKDNNQ